MTLSLSCHISSCMAVLTFTINSLEQNLIDNYCRRHLAPGQKFLAQYDV